MTFETIDFSISSNIAKITLDRPERLNSFNTKMHQEVKDAIFTVQTNSEIRCLLLSGTGKAFSAGQDLKSTEDLSQVLNDYYNPLIQSITTMDKPVICAVNGIAAGAGANIALACDIVIAAKSAQFLQAFTKIGLIPDAGGTWMLPKLVGHARARAISLLAEPVSAEQAEQWGMIWKSVDDDKLISYCDNLAQKLADSATVSLAYTKRLLQVSENNTLADQLELEKQYQNAAATTEDYKEGLLAFLEKRKANFVGR